MERGRPRSGRLPSNLAFAVVPLLVLVIALDVYCLINLARAKSVRYLLNTHAHFDHSGGLAALKSALLAKGAAASAGAKAAAGISTKLALGGIAAAAALVIGLTVGPRFRAAPPPPSPTSWAATSN